MEHVKTKGGMTYLAFFILWIATVGMLFLGIINDIRNIDFDIRMYTPENVDYAVEDILASDHDTTSDTGNSNGQERVEKYISSLRQKKFTLKLCGVGVVLYLLVGVILVRLIRVGRVKTLLYLLLTIVNIILMK